VEGVRICWIRTAKYQRAKSILRVLSWLDFELRLWLLPKEDLPRPDVIVVSSLSLLTVFNGLWLRRRFGCRLVFEVRDIWPLTIVEEGGFSPFNPLVVGLGMIERLAYRKADEIVGTMPNLRQHVDEVAHHHAPVHCIPFGVAVDADKEAPPLPEEWVDQHIPKGKFIICHAGTIGITNALDTLFECARSMQDHAGVHFLLVGDGDLRAQYETTHSALPNVTFTGAVSKELVQSVLAHADLCYFAVHPSRVWNYGLSLNKVIDYMLAGKPVVASYTGYPTMIDEAGSGVSVPASDAGALKKEILRVLSLSPAEREAMGRKGRDWLLRNRPYRKLAEDYLQLALSQHV